ncbi:hypothetical protein [Streptomyces hydrogenans]|uniref:hypothetical protein n=1 Tax=Streptomyces hydrogenans TaxID=1873719 RepID=UPI0036E5D4D0
MPAEDEQVRARWDAVEGAVGEVRQGDAFGGGGDEGQAPARQARTEELLRGQETCVEELFDALLDGPGFPETVRSAPQL